MQLKDIKLTKSDAEAISWGLTHRSLMMYQDAVAYKRQGNEEAFADCHKEYLRCQELSNKFYTLARDLQE